MLLKIITMIVTVSIIAGVGIIVIKQLDTPIQTNVTITAVSITGFDNDTQNIFAAFIPIAIVMVVILVVTMIINAISPKSILIGWEAEDEDDYEEIQTEKPHTHPQTYEEYVDERLAIERKLRWGWLGRLVGIK